MHPYPFLQVYKHLEKLLSLPNEHRVAFATSCNERLLPNYEAFTIVENWGDYSLLRKSVDMVWLYLRKEISVNKLEGLAQLCESNLPANDDFSSLFSALAFSACSSVIYCLQSCTTNNPEYSMWAGITAIDSINTYVYSVNTPNLGPHIVRGSFDKWLSSSPLLRAEFDKQEETLKTLSGQSKLDTVFLDEIQKSSTSTGIFPLERGLIVKR